MADLSTIAETIADYAVSIAKRNENEKAGELHVLAAIHRWSPEKFEARFPEIAIRLEAALRRFRGESLRVTGLEAEIGGRLRSVKDADDVLALAAELVLSLDSVIADAPSAKAEGSATSESGTLADAGTIVSRPDTKVGVASGSPVAVSNPFPITESLLHRVTEVCGGDLEATTQAVMSDALAVAVRVLGRHAEDLLQRILDAAGLEDVQLPDEPELSTLVHRVSVVDRPDAGKTGTQLALALVEVAEWAAVMDDTVTEEETGRIDDIRREFRRQLGDRLNAESPAMEEFERKFGHLVGMQSVKTELRKRVDFLVVSRRRRRQGHAEEPQRMHMAFVGNPGTGKTTVARLYGELLNDLDLLPSRKFVETDRSGLVGEYVGHTEKNTMAKINEADGGVLFIDEVYALNDRYSNDRKGYGEEATDVIVKQMEDRRDRLVVVIAGYPEETREFLNMNPGLSSRVPVTVEFPDYSREELAAIAERIAARSGLNLEPAAVERIGSLLETQRARRGFGNARSVENLLEEARRNAVSRLSEYGNLATADELSTVLVTDIPDVLPPAVESRREILGFRRPTDS